MNSALFILQPQFIFTAWCPGVAKDSALVRRWPDSGSSAIAADRRFAQGTQDADSRGASEIPPQTSGSTGNETGHRQRPE
jgi:hypothetical protein